MFNKKSPTTKPFMELIKVYYDGLSLEDKEKIFAVRRRPLRPGKPVIRHVAVHLKKKGIDTILVGGAVVSIYSNGAYHSGDLDFVKASMFVTKLDETMSWYWKR